MFDVSDINISDPDLRQIPGLIHSDIRLQFLETARVGCFIYICINKGSACAVFVSNSAAALNVGCILDQTPLSQAR